jgi:predicted site-specific integrase-resolvase
MISNETLPHFVTATEMAERLGVRASAVRRWARRGAIPKLVLPNGRFVFDPAAVIAAMQSRQNGGTRRD